MKKKAWITAVLLLVVNLLLKILFLDAASIAWDEPFSIYHAQMDAGKIIYHLYNGNNPPGFELLLHFWIKLFGIGPFSVRFLPFLFSSFTAVMVFVLGNKVFNYRTGLITALLFTFSNFHLFFAHEARVYSLFGLLTVTAIYLFTRFIGEAKRKSDFVWLVLVNALLLYTHYFGFFVFAVQGVSILLIKELRRRYFLRFFGAGVCVLLLFLPNLLILAGRFRDSASNGTWIAKPDGIVNLYNMLWNFSNQPVTTVFCLVILVSALVKLIVQKDFKQIQTEKKIVAIWFLFPFFFMFFISFVVPMFLDRYLIFVSFGYYFLVAISLDYLVGHRIAKYTTAAVLVLLFGLTFKPNLDNKRHVKETIAKIKELKDEHTSVIICGRDFVLNFAYYYEPTLFKAVDQEKVYDKMIRELNKEDIFPVYSMPEDLKLKPRVVYLDAAADFSNPGNRVLEVLNQRYELKAEHHFETVFNVYVFEAKE